MEEAEECSRLVIMAAGRVVAVGTTKQIIGPERTVVPTANWAAALRGLEAAGLRAVLSGRVLRVPGAAAAQVAEALGDLPAAVGEEPATLDERFFNSLAPKPRA